MESAFQAGLIQAEAAQSDMAAMTGLVANCDLGSRNLPQTSVVKSR
jgi:hypothetical protein